MYQVQWEQGWVVVVDQAAQDTPITHGHCPVLYLGERESERESERERERE